MKLPLRRPRAPASLRSPHGHAARVHPALDAVAVARAASLLRAAGDPGRLRLLLRLLGGEMCVSELAAESRDEISLISQRLRILRAEKLVSRRREGKHVYYALADKHVAMIVRSTLEHALEELGNLNESENQ